MNEQEKQEIELYSQALYSQALEFHRFGLSKGEKRDWLMAVHYYHKALEIWNQLDNCDSEKADTLCELALLTIGRMEWAKKTQVV